MIDFWIGGYARQDQPGIRRFSLDADTGRIMRQGEYAGLENPSWLLCHPERPVLYTVEELNPNGRIVALRAGRKGLERICAMSSGGADPCHLSLSPDGGTLFCANYSSGSLSLFALDAEGVPTGMCALRQHAMDAPTPGAVPGRQEGPHVHFSLCDGRWVYVNDLGLNRTFIYDWDARHQSLGEVVQALEYPPGSGPRHLALSADGSRLYVLCELTATVHVFALEANRWQEIQAVSALPAVLTDRAACNHAIGAAIRIADGRLYASCRGSHTIAAFDIAGDGTLASRRFMEARGRTPRDFQVMDGWLIAANQDSGCVALMRLDERGSGAPDAQTIGAVAPSCVCRIPAGWPVSPDNL